MSEIRHHRHRHRQPPGRVGGNRIFCAGYGLEILLAAVATVALVCGLALISSPSIGREISFIAPYQPQAEWYFLWSYQAARYFPGAWAFLGLVVLPVAGGVGLLLLPTIDGDTRGGRIKALGLCGVMALLFLTLTARALFP